MTTPLDEVSKLSAIIKYLNLLKENQLVKPSIGKCYPEKNNEENKIMHRALLDIQNTRIRDMNEKISTLLVTNDISHADVRNNPLFIEKWEKLKKKAEFLKRKFRVKRETLVRPNQASRNKKSRERYKIRKFNRLLKTIGTDSILNLSSIPLTPSQNAVLSLGSGFIPASTNSEKEEEIILLESLRVIDRLGKLDETLKNELGGNREDDTISNKDENYKSTDIHSNFQQTDFFESSGIYSRSRDIPSSLKIHQPQERTLSQPITKLIKKKFDEHNSKLLNLARLKNRRNRHDKLPKKLRVVLKELQKLTREKKIDIRKVDKGDMIIIIDFEQRKIIEQRNIDKIAALCGTQKSNWLENKTFVEDKLKQLFDLKFIDQKELTSVTGLLPGGVKGSLKNKDGTIKYTRAIDTNEYFSKQDTPYIYPLLKAHKLTLEELKSIKPDEVCDKIPARLVIGMSSCQMSRVQAWLESFLTPL